MMCSVTRIRSRLRHLPQLRRLLRNSGDLFHRCRSSLAEGEHTIAFVSSFPFCFAVPMHVSSRSPLVHCSCSPCAYGQGFPSLTLTRACVPSMCSAPLRSVQPQPTLGRPHRPATGTARSLLLQPAVRLEPKEEER
jgi:hypothetical protein